MFMLLYLKRRTISCEKLLGYPSWFCQIGYTNQIRRVAARILDLLSRQPFYSTVQATIPENIVSFFNPISHCLGPFGQVS